MRTAGLQRDQQRSIVYRPHWGQRHALLQSYVRQYHRDRFHNRLKLTVREPAGELSSLR